MACPRPDHGAPTLTELPHDTTGRYGYQGPGDVSFLRWVAQVPGVIGGILNVGCYKGLSCSVLATAGGAPVVCVDPFPKEIPTESPSFVPTTFEEWADNMGACGVADRIIHVRAPSQEALPKLRERGMKFRVAFVDGDHTYPACYQDIAEAMLLLSPGGFLVLDDYLSFPGIRQAVAEFGGAWVRAGDKMGYLVKA